MDSICIFYVLYSRRGFCILYDLDFLSDTPLISGLAGNPQYQALSTRRTLGIPRGSAGYIYTLGSIRSGGMNPKYAEDHLLVAVRSVLIMRLSD